ncbi:unnamed protein product [Lathyrus oleraceus]
MHLKRISREFRHQLFEKCHERCSRSRGRSHYKHQSYEERSHRSRISKYDDRDRVRDYHHESDNRRRIRSPIGRRNRSIVRDGSDERRARIE